MNYRHYAIHYTQNLFIITGILPTFPHFPCSLFPTYGNHKRVLYFYEFNFYFIIILFSYLFLAVLGQHCCTGFSLVCGEQGLLSSCDAWASVVAEHGLSNYGSQALEHRLNSCSAQALLHVGFSWTRVQTCVTCIGRQILYHWATRKALIFILDSTRKWDHMVLVFLCLIYFG